VSEHYVQVNGRRHSLEGVDPNTSLLWFLRGRGLTGAKEGCAEGECGACAVVLVRNDERDRARYEAVNSCLVLAVAMAGQEVLTAEGMGKKEALHPVQSAMVEQAGSQCGYCTPGFIASMFAEVYRPERDGYDPESIGGNLCRCTGYRPIRDAMRSLPLAPPDDAFATRLGKPAPPLESVRHQHGERRFYRPSSLEELFAVLADEPEAKLLAGGTDMAIELTQRYMRHACIVSLEGVTELHAFEESDEAVSIGAGVPLTQVERRLGERLPVLHTLFNLFSSRLIRNRATLGGNLVNASPIGDSPPVLLALGAELVLARSGGERTVPLDGFFTGYRQTILEPREVVRAVRLPKPFPTFTRFFKVSKREMDDISTVAGAFAIELEGGLVKTARLAYGGVAATPIRAHEAERVLVGSPWSESSLRAASAALEKAGTPMTDHRGSAAYRRAMINRLLERFFHETQEGHAA